MEMIDYLRLARELTGSSDIKELMTSALFLRSEMEKETSQPDIQTQLDSWLNVRKPSDFLQHLSFHHPIKGTVPFVPYNFQKNLVDKLEESRDRLAVLNVARQMGTTYTLLALALFRAVTKPEQTIMLLSTKLADSLEQVHKISFMVNSCSLSLPDVVEYNKASLKFNNGSRVIGGSFGGRSGCGYSLDTVIVSDAAYVPWSKEDEWWESVQPCMKDNGQIILSSCPNKTKGLFYDQWEKKSPSVTKLKYTWRSHPERDEAWAWAMRKHMGEEFFKREYECEFADHNQ